MSKKVTVQKYKYNGHLKSSWTGRILNSPDPNWVLVLHDPTRDKKYSGTKDQTHKDYFVHGFHKTKPLAFLIQYKKDHTVDNIKCDAAIPAEISNAVIKFVDLDLDLIVNHKLKHHVRDRIAFAKRAIKWRYPKQVRQQAYAGIKLAKKLVRKKQFPFSKPLYPNLKLKD